MGNKQSSGGGPSLGLPKLGGVSQTALKELVRRANTTGVMNAEKMNLKELPELLCELSLTLRTLDLSHNKLNYLADFLCNFSSLKQLSLDNNNLTQLPNDIGNMDKLESLSINHNQLTSLPASLSRLNRLKTLSVQANRLTVIPDSVCNLTHVQVIDLSNNMIHTWPTQQKLSSLNAVELNLNQNRLSTLSNGLIDCKKLKILRLQENCLPLNSFTPQILSQSSICLISYEANLFEDKAFNHIEGYDDYMLKYTANKKKMF